MKKNTLKSLILSAATLPFSLLSAQNLIYKDSHREVEYNYAIIDSGTFDQLSETEKIKYELKYSEKSFIRKITSDYSTTLEISIDSNGYNKDWLRLPRKMIFSNTGISLYDTDDSLMNVLRYSEEQVLDRANNKLDIIDKGYHPGLISFPESNQELSSQFPINGIGFNDFGGGKFSLTENGSTTIYDKSKLLITTEGVDEDGNKTKDYDGYSAMEGRMGYLQVISKNETAIKSINGPCLTKVKLVYYFDYQIEDITGLIKKAINQIPETILIYPNPNQGVFKVHVQLNLDNTILLAKAINMLTGEIFFIDSAINEGVISVNLPDLTSGIYAIQIQTNNSILSRQFIKQ